MKMSILFSASLLLLAQPCFAQNTQPLSWVSEKAGSDVSDCGPVTKPCKTFQYAHDSVMANGAILVRDPGSYGPLTIKKSVAIINDGVGVAGALSPGASILVSAGVSDSIVIKGLTFDGLNVAPGSTGIKVNSAGSVTIVDSTIQRFGRGLWVQPTVGSTVFSLRNCRVSNNALNIFVQNGAGQNVKGQIVNSIISHGSTGLFAFTPDPGGVTVILRKSAITYNDVGIDSAGANIVGREITSSFNQKGVRADAGSVLLSLSNLSGNSVQDVSRDPAATVSSTGDNLIDTIDNPLAPFAYQ